MSEQKEKFLQRLAEISAELSQENNSSPGVSLDHDFSLKKPFLSDRTIEELLEEGYIGVDYDLVADTAFAAAAHKFKDKIKWTRTRADENGDVALMTPLLAEFDRLLEFMLDEFGWCPQVHSNEKSPDIFIFESQNELEEAAIAATIEGDYGWKESLYSLDYYDTAEEGNLVCFIFATLPKDEGEQE
ncbi:MAG: hypothetical protein QNJ38_17740 [Prochloraceae cyanobacterium]|nr:hypothetical protein [Prochloraceae cyanobacterium]